MRPMPDVDIHAIQANWKHPTDIRFGLHRIQELPDICWELGISHPLLVTDKGVADLAFVQDMLSAAHHESIHPGIFAQIQGEPDAQCIKQGALNYRQGGFNGIVAVGGGSALDAAKAIALAACVGPRRLWLYTADACSGPAPALPLPSIIAVPTTAGTGSEVDANAVITEEGGDRKVSLYHPQLMPKVVIADPILTTQLIPYLTAATGMDALSHNLEALCSPVFQPILDAIAVQGVGFLKEWLPVAVAHGEDKEARMYTMAASIMGAMAFEKGLGAMHAIAHAVGARFKIHHGRVIGAVMPYVLQVNLPHIESKMEALARRLDLAQYNGQAVLDWILDLRLEIGLPHCLAELGVRQEHVPDLVRTALQDVNVHTNPEHMEETVLSRVLGRAISGELEKD